jgi:hypothetical protein
MIIRAWLEPGSSNPLRAQVRLTTDVTAGFSTELTLAEVGEVSATMERWLAEVVANAQPVPIVEP